MMSSVEAAEPADDELLVDLRAAVGQVPAALRERVGNLGLLTGVLLDPSAGGAARQVVGER
jgi:hypothetical protein